MGIVIEDRARDTRLPRTSTGTTTTLNIQLRTLPGILLCLRMSGVSLIFLVALPIMVAAYPWSEEGPEESEFADGALDTFNNVERREWCSRWGDFCRPDAKLKFAQCCPGLRCMCGHFWTQGKCQCKSKGTFGR